jgi:cation transport ATPase
MKRANPRILTIAPGPLGSETDAQNPSASVADAVSADPAILQKELAAQKYNYLRLAASPEQSSEHPHAAAIVQGAKEQGIVLDAVKDFRSVAAGVPYPFFRLLLSPVIAGAAMSLSSVSVISNALRLRKVRL